MIIDINTATNEELENELDIINESFEAVKAECYSKYIALTKISEEYEKIKKVLDKRKGIKDESGQ